MKLVASLVALAGSVSVLAPLAIAQSGPVRPQYYSWEKYPLIQDDPQYPDFYVHDDRFMSMIRIELGADDNDSRPYTPDEAAAATVAELVVRLSEPTGATITNDRVAITIQNLGGHAPTVHSDSLFSFLRNVDSVSVTGLTDGDPDEYKLYQPWMGFAVGKYVLNQQTQQLEWRTGDATTWMTEYCAALKSRLVNAGLEIAPARFHIDNETTLFGTSWNKAIVQTMLACEQDSRWDTAEVPGFPGQTMLDLWHAAQDEYDWKNSNGTYRTLAQVLNPDEYSFHVDNNPYCMWWISVGNRALATAMKRCVQDPIHAAWPNAEVLVSNYNDASADMGRDTFAYREVTKLDYEWVTDSNGDLYAQSAQTDTQKTNEFFRGLYSLDSRGSLPKYAAVSTTSGPPIMFQMGPLSNFCDFDSPVLYYPEDEGDADKVQDHHLQGKLYEPRDGSGNPVPETVAESMRRTFRHNLDAVLATPGNAEHGIAPWIAIPGVHVIDTSGTEPGIDEARRMLALLRSKDIREIILWSNKPTGGRGDSDAWNILKRADDQVYTPYLKSAELVRGAADSAYTWTEDALNTTLVTDVVSDQLVIIGEYAGSPSHHHVTEVVVTFEDVKPLSLGNNGRLVLECAVDPVNATQGYSGWRAAVTGYVSMWNYQLEQWDPVVTIMDAGFGSYKFYVDSPLIVGATATRREFDLGYANWDGLCPYLSDQENCDIGSLKFKFVHLAPELTSGFNSRYDLIQFYHTDDVFGYGLSMSPESESMNSSQDASDTAGFLAADFNFDGVQDATDAELFATAWGNSDRRADYNADGEVDTLDLTQFLAALGRATSSGSSGTSEE
jgi:hypothetical protein